MQETEQSELTERLAFQLFAANMMSPGPGQVSRKACEEFWTRDGKRKGYYRAMAARVLELMQCAGDELRRRAGDPSCGEDFTTMFAYAVECGWSAQRAND